MNAKIISFDEVKHSHDLHMAYLKAKYDGQSPADEFVHAWLRLVQYYIDYFWGPYRAYFFARFFA